MSRPRAKGVLRDLFDAVPEAVAPVQDAKTLAFIEKARARHGDRYGYDEVVYVHSLELVTIICPVHDRFSQIASVHLSGHGCQICGAGHRADTAASFIAKAREVHGDRYGYDAVVYVNSLTDVLIECREHGHFPQGPASHIRGNGCRSCGRIEQARKRTIPVERFIERAKAIHGDRYGYEEVAFVNRATPVTILCPTHDRFTQTPKAHLVGKGCASCAVSQRARLSRSSTHEFVAKAKALHGDRYGYEDVSYVTNYVPVIIHCPLHDVFEQIPNAHLSGQGCPRCVGSVSKLETEWLDSLGIPEEVRQARFKLNGVAYNPDALDPVTKIIHLFHGVWWHGHPDYFERDDIHPTNKKTYRYLYDRTMRRDQALRDAGYTVVIMWEHDWWRLTGRTRMTTLAEKAARAMKKAA